MPVTVKSDRLGPGTLSLGAEGSAEQWADSLTKIAIEPSVDRDDDTNLLSGKTLPGEVQLTYTLQGTVLQSYAKDSLIEWCFANRLEQVPFVYVPSNTAKRARKGTVEILPITDGGDVKARNTSDFEFRIIGEPEYVDML